MRNMVFFRAHLPQTRYKLPHTVVLLPIHQLYDDGPARFSQQSNVALKRIISSAGYCIFRGICSSRLDEQPTVSRAYASCHGLLSRVSFDPLHTTLLHVQYIRFTNPSPRRLLIEQFHMHASPVII